jgi:hypothetical protein
MATAKKAPAEEPQNEPNLPEDAKLSQSASAGHGTPELKARVVESTGGPVQDEHSAPAREYADEANAKGFVSVKHADPEEKLGVEPGNEQKVWLAAVAKGFIGEQADETPNEHYTVAGVTSGKPTPENPEGRTGTEQRQGK